MPMPLPNATPHGGFANATPAAVSTALPTLINATPPRGQYNIDDATKQSLHRVLNKIMNEARQYQPTPQFYSLPYADQIRQRIGDETTKSFFEMASLGGFSMLAQDLEEFRERYSQQELSYLLNIQYSGPETFSHNNAVFEGLRLYNYDGYSLLHFMWHIGQNSVPRDDQYLFWMTSYLLQCGIDPNLQDARGETAMHTAVWWFGGASYDMFRAWFSPEAGVRGGGAGLAESNDLDRKKFGLKTNRELYEHYARCCMAVVGMLLEYGADWNARDNAGRTVEDVWKEIHAKNPPHVAQHTTDIRFGKQECVEAYRHFVQHADQSIAALLDERSRGWEFCHLISEDPMWVATVGVVAKEVEYKAYPAKRQELIAARTPQPEKGAVAAAPSSNVAREEQRRQERQQAKDDACCVVM